MYVKVITEFILAHRILSNIVDTCNNNLKKIDTSIIRKREKLIYKNNWVQSVYVGIDSMGDILLTKINWMFVNQ